MFNLDSAQDERDQWDLRAQLNPNWQAQRRAHFQTLGVNEPVNKPAKQIINESLQRQGLLKKRRSRKSVFE